MEYYIENLLHNAWTKLTIFISITTNNTSENVASIGCNYLPLKDLRDYCFAIYMQPAENGQSGEDTSPSCQPCYGDPGCSECWPTQIRQVQLAASRWQSRGPKGPWGPNGPWEQNSPSFWPKAEQILEMDGKDERAHCMCVKCMGCTVGLNRPVTHVKSNRLSKGWSWVLIWS